MLPRDQAQPGGQVTTIVEQVGLRYGCIESGGDHRPHTFDGGQALARLSRREHLENLAVHPLDAFVQPEQLLIEFLKQLPTRKRQAVIRVFQETGQARA
jgi:hypothetical protein